MSSQDQEDPEPNFSQQEIDVVINDVVSNVREDLEDDTACEWALQRLLHTWYSKVKTSQSPIDLPQGIPHRNDFQDSEDNDSVIGPNSVSVPVKHDGEMEHIVDPEATNNVVKEESPNKEDEIEAKCHLRD